jgi:glycosyltransferase XagB
MTSLVIAPPLWPFFAALVFHHLSLGALAPASPHELAMAVLWISAVVFGVGSILWLALLGMNRRRLMKLWPSLPLVPLYYLLASVAAWMARFMILFRVPTIGIKRSTASPRPHVRVRHWSARQRPMRC